MYKKIDTLGNQVQLNKSDIKGLKKSLLYAFPLMEPYLDDIIPQPKTVPIYSMKLKENDKTVLYIVDQVPLFFKVGKQAIPTLHMLHKYPHVMKKAVVDTGAIKYLLSGADMMAPGFTSEGGWLPGIGKQWTGGNDLDIIFAQQRKFN